MDAFFAACEERENPHLAGRPLVIGADPKGGGGRGVVSTANYPARVYCIRSAMPISKAWELAEAAKRRGEPDTVFLDTNYRLYSEVSKRIMAIVSRETVAFEEASIDEAYADISSLGTFERAIAWAKMLKQHIKEQEQLTCSIGIGPNKLIAKIASDFKKPDGLTVVRPEEVEAFLEPMSIRAIPGIGPKTEQLLNLKDIKTIRDLKDISEETLKDILGKWGSDLYQKARGMSDSPVSDAGEAKSIGAQETLEIDTFEPPKVFELLSQLVDAVFHRFQRDFSGFRTVAIAVRFADFETLSRARTLQKPERTKAALQRTAIQLLLPFLDSRGNPKRKKIRLIGVRVEKLTSRKPV